VAGTITFHQADATRRDEYLLGRDSSQGFILPVDSPPDSLLRDNASGAARVVALAAKIATRRWPSGSRPGTCGGSVRPDPVFGLGCFWGAERKFWQALGVYSTAVGYAGGAPTYTWPAAAPEPNELGFKETVRMNPGEVTRVLMKFDLPSTPFAAP
jgi:hypothetical protein